MITMGSPYFVWKNTNEIILSWYLLDAVCVTPPGRVEKQAREYLSMRKDTGVEFLATAERSLGSRRYGLELERFDTRPGHPGR